MLHALSLPFPGVLQVLRHGERLKLWDLRVLDPGKPVPIEQGGAYLLGAWHPLYERLLPMLLNAGSKVSVLWTSSGGEVGFEPLEQGYLDRIMRAPMISHVWCGHRGLAEVLGGKAFHAPYPIDIAIPRPSPEAVPEPVMTFFAPPTLKKNIVNNLLAAAIIQERRPEMVLETNMPVPEFLRDRLRHRAYDWLPDERYRPLLAASSLNLCCSWAETLSYQSIEAALYGVPSVGSHAIPWLPDWATASPDDPRSIAAVGERLIGNEQFAGLARTWAAAANDEARAAVRHLML